MGLFCSSEAFASARTASGQVPLLCCDLPDRIVTKAVAILPSPVGKHRAVDRHHQGMCIRMSCCSQCWRHPMRAACPPCSEPFAWGCPCPTPPGRASRQARGPTAHTVHCKCLYPWPSGSGDMRMLLCPSPRGKEQGKTFSWKLPPRCWCPGLMQCTKGTQPTRLNQGASYKP